jgi:hypothetical protein
MTPQKPLDASDDTVRLTLRLTKRLTDRIDEKRGDIPRSSYIRALIDSALSDGQPAIAYRLQFHEQVQETGAEVIAAGLADVKQSVKQPPKEKHWHRFKKAGEPVSHIKGVPQFRQLCTCGETRVGP